MAKVEKSKRFKYALESVLKFRKHRESLEQEKYQALVQLAIQEKQKEEEMKAFQAAKYMELRELMTGQHALPDTQIIMQRKAHLERLQEDIDKQVQKVKDAENKRDKQRLVLVDAVKDKKIMEKDKEKKRDMWKELMKKEEAKFMDEISSIGFVRKKRVEAAEKQDDLSPKNP